MKLTDYEVNEMKLHNAVEAGISSAVRKKAPRRMRIWAVAAVVVLLSASALAATLLSGSVDFNGQFAPEVQQTFSPADDTAQQRSLVLAEQAEQLLESTPEGELWACLMPDGSTQYQVANQEMVELSSAMSRISKAGIKLPSYIPDGFAPVGCQLTYFLPANMLDTVISYEEAQHDGGIVLRKYRLGADIRENIAGYLISYVNPDGRLLTIAATLSTQDSTEYFGLDDAQAYEVVSVPGMAKALYVKGSVAHPVLYAKQIDLPAQAYALPMGLWDSTLSAPCEYNAVVYELSGPLNKDELVRIAKDMK